MNFVRALWRLAAALGQALAGALICALCFPFLAPPQRMAQVGRWSRRMLRALGIRLEARGAIHAGPLLVVANHVSWVDILAVNALHPVRFVSKADVKRWPLLGFMVASGGTLFIERERKRDALRVVHQIAEALRAGDIVAVFPEGTTSDGHDVLPFHANLLQAAIATGAPVQPLVLRYRDAQAKVSQAPAYVGDTSLAASLWATVTADELVAEVIAENAQGTRHADRRALAEHLRETILGRLNEGRE
ncbi:lysophospholipid acyltransferase family protein [Piscinibacter sp.]|uniref:lysophospholipid acyltransferase family protein n=1 Tax=Piscinibacter sp. TaxID=1903157 RepID=UPI0039E3AE2D